MKEKFFNLSWDNLSTIFKQFTKSYYITLFQLPVLAEAIWNNFPSEIWRAAFSKGGLPNSDEVFEMGRDEILSIVLNPINLYRQNLRRIPPLPGSPIKIPVLLLIPLNDMAILPESYHNTSEYVDNLEIHHLAANHWVHREKPQLVNSLLAKFLSKKPSLA